MAYDGTLKFDTGIDTSGFQKGILTLANTAKTGLKAAVTAIAGGTTAVAGIGAAAIKAGADFEAQMSRVKAISGATGAEFEKLKDQAIQLGSDTAFSASEAAEGMENLAAAGFETSEIMDAMPGLLDLAAASGESLANSSDIAASTLRGFGLAASEAGHVADVLAENANRTNSSVADTGEAMKYIAPLARAAGISLEETAAAIGIMANAGIQGSQAGTTLRGALSRLSKPTKDMKEAMDELKISFYDSEGRMLSLSDQVGMLRTAMEGMTDEQKNNYLVTLYGQEALSGMLALINEGEGSLRSLTAAYEQCDGSAKAAADTMMDNVKGAVEELSGSAESLGIKIYEHIADPLKNAAQEATESINAISDALGSGGIEAAVEKAGEEFAELSVGIAEQAPKLADAGAGAVSAFLNGIVKNRDKIYNSGVDIASSLAGGLAKMLPKELSEPVEDAIDDITKSLKSGGLKKAGETVVRMFENISDITGKLAKTALPPLTKALDACAENMDLILPLAVSGAAAFKTYGSVMKALSVQTKANAAATAAMTAMEKANALQLVATNGGLTIRQTLMGVYNGQITATTALTGLWAKAQTALNAVMSANPIGLVITAVAALAAGIGALYLVSEKQTLETAKLSEEQEKLCESIDQSAEELEDFQTSMQDSVQSSMQETDAINALWTELGTLVDANGRVKEGYEARVAYITGELSSALGVEMELIDGVVQGYADQKEAIQELIETKRAQAALDGMEQSYLEAVQQSTIKLNEWMAAAKESNQVSTDLATAKQTLADLEAKAAEEAKIYGTATMETQEALKAAMDNVEGLSTKYDGLADKTEKAKTTYEGYQSVIQQYEGLSAAIISGDVDAMSEALLNLQTNFTRYGEVADEEFKKIVLTATDNMAQLGQAIKDGTIKAGDAGVAEMANSTAAYLAELSKMPGGAAAIAEEINPQMLGALAGLSGSLSEESRNAVAGFIEGLSGLDEETRSKFEDAVRGAIEGSEFGDEVAAKADEMGISYLDALAEVLEVHSPSRAVARIFAQVWPGAVQGLSEGQESLNETGSTVVQSFLTSLTNGSVLEGARTAGATLISLFSGGALSQTENSYLAGKTNADSANAGAASVDPTPTGSLFGSLLNSGIGAMGTILNLTGKSIADMARAGAGSVDPTEEGKTFGTLLSDGIGSISGILNSTGKTVAESARTGAASVDPTGEGRDFGTMLSNGIYAISRTLNNTGRSVAESARAGAGSISPDREGRSFGQAYADAIRNKSAQAQSSASYIARAAEGYRGLQSVSARSAGYNFGAGFGGGVTSAIRSAVNAAASLARSALSAIKSTLGINSPAKATIEAGEYTGDGMVVGMDNRKKAVAAAGKRMSDTVMNSIDTEGIAERMKAAVNFQTGRIAFDKGANATYKVEKELHGMFESGDTSVEITGETHVHLELEGEEVGHAVVPTVDKDFARIDTHKKRGG